MALHPMLSTVNGRKTKILLKISTGFDGLFMLDEHYEHNPHVAHPLDESTDPTQMYIAAIARVEALRAAGFDVALDVKHRLT